MGNLFSSILSFPLIILSISFTLIFNSPSVYSRGFDFEDFFEEEPLTADKLIDLPIEELMQVKVVTTATGVKQSEVRAPSVISVITARDMEMMGARTLEEVLQTVPGLQVSYSWFNIPIYTMRGISSANNPEILVLINGIRVNDSYIGAKGLYWNGFPISAISRIEIIRGPGSAVYGADAFSGVINLITKSAREINGTEVGVRLGNFNTQDSWILHGSRWNGFKIAAMADFSHTDGHHRTVESDAQTNWDQVFGTHASLAPGPYASDITTYDARIDIIKQQWQFRAGIHKGDDMGTGVGIGQALDPTEPMLVERINADLTYHDPQFTDNWDVQAQLSYLQTGLEVNYQIFPPGAFGGAYPIGYIGEPSAFQRDTQLALSGSYDGLNNHLIKVGTGYANYDMYKTSEVKNFGTNPFTNDLISPTELINVEDTSAVFAPEVSRNNKYVFLQDTWTIDPNWELTTGVRYDNYSDFGATTNPRLGLVWIPRSDFTAKLLYGHAFRAPSFSELHNQNNPIAIGDPNLKPEQIGTWEIVFDYQKEKNLHLTLNLFHYDIKDKISFISKGNSEYQHANASNWKGQGGEFELRWKPLWNLGILFNYSYQHSKDDVTKVILNNAPKQSAFLRGDYLLMTDWYLDTQVHWIDDWTRDANDPRPALKGYTTVDLILRRRNLDNKRANFAFGIRNLFDVDVRYPSAGPDDSGIVNVPNDLPGAGRFFFGEIRYKF